MSVVSLVLGLVVEVGSGSYAFAYPATNLELPAPSLPAAP
jgi:hypothetical protein